MSEFFDAAKNVADQHDQQVDEVLQKAGEEVDTRSGDRYDKQVREAVDQAQEHTGQGDQVP